MRETVSRARLGGTWYNYTNIQKCNTNTGMKVKGEPLASEVPAGQADAHRAAASAVWLHACGCAWQ